ncbi:rod-determining factor RdfA [Natranaeroarchaeum aerophilus]|uniref:Uncharacterized protein n=1 Tax=Natranaeroarchaeum aerophilus TaxID=2917711 RepID=A0AAE3FSZ3_9EURY|nr:rod-determining factor RdfA [Natranaeroarchaeum aerophilus]MCL9814039.1 hypothetical protein [Natranaeroarchaeum aerophilus]
MNSSDERFEDVPCNCKVGRVLEEYDLAALNDELVAYWTGRGEERYSLRELATYVNRSTLRAAMDEAGVAYKDGEVENTYRLLTDDDVSSGMRTETRRELEHDSVPVEQVESDFVSHQTVHNHLTDCLDASMVTPDDEERVESARDKIRALQNRTVAVTDDTIDRLDRSDVIDLGEYDVLVDVSIICSDCGRQYTAGDLLERGGCECQTDSAPERSE